MHSGSSKNAARCGIVHRGWMDDEVVMGINGDLLRIYSDCSRISDLIGVGIGMLNMNRDLIGIYYMPGNGVAIMIYDSSDVDYSDSIGI